jgi:hypothetical protein
MGKKKNDHKVEPSQPAEEKRHFKVSLWSSVARTFYTNWMPCVGWRLSMDEVVPIPSVPHPGPQWNVEIERQCSFLPPYLLHDPDFAVDSPMWDNYHHHHVVLNKRQGAGFLGDKDFNFG